MSKYSDAWKRFKVAHKAEADASPGRAKVIAEQELKSAHEDLEQQVATDDDENVIAKKEYDEWGSISGPDPKTVVVKKR
jgi:hypothetical protein